MGGHALDKGGAVLLEQFALLTQIGSDLDHGLAGHLAVFGDVGLRHRDGCIHNGAGAFGEPCIETPVQGNRCENSDNDGWEHRDEAEQPDHADMQASARNATPTRHKEPQHLPADKARHGCNENEVGDEECQHKRLGWLDGGKPGQDHIGRQTAQDGCHNDGHGAYRTEPMAEVKTSAPGADLRFLNGV